MALLVVIEPLTAGAGMVLEYPIPTPASDARAITLGPDGALWFKETGANKIGWLEPNGKFTEFPVPLAGAENHGITAGPDGAI